MGWAADRGDISGNGILRMLHKHSNIEV
jgi:hypothetical protein